VKVGLYGKLPPILQGLLGMWPEVSRVTVMVSYLFYSPSNLRALIGVTTEASVDFGAYLGCGPAVGAT